MRRRLALRTGRDRLLTVLLVGAIAEILWAGYLGWRLPRRYEATHWAVAWVGLDVLEILLLLATAWAAWRRRAILVLFSSATATTLVLDAWFDVTTAGRGDLLESVLVAVFVEVPSAIALLWIARRAARRLMSTHPSGPEWASAPLHKIPLHTPDLDASPLD